MAADGSTKTCWHLETSENFRQKDMIPSSPVTASDVEVATFAEASAVVMDTELDMMTKNHNTDFAWLKTDSDLQKIVANSASNKQNCLSYIK